MNAKHTPGPWHITRKPYSGGEQLEIEYAPGDILRNRLLCVVWPFNNGDYANARLIAAAPELLAALEEMMREFEPATQWQNLPEPDCLILARAAIRRAKGE